MACEREHRKLPCGLACMLSLDAKELAYSQLIQVIRSKTAAGFVPNFAAGQVKTTDRTEPPIGAKVLQGAWVWRLSVEPDTKLNSANRLGRLGQSGLRKGCRD